jgi:DNA-binding transcriptional LysR family regulator
VQAAAAELNVTQPAISQAVRQLEDHVGVPLLDRGSRPARPTEAGRRWPPPIAEGLGQIGDMIDTLRQADTQRARTVTVACSVGVATYWLMPRLLAFYRAHPEFLVNVVTTQSGAPPLAEGVDVAIRYGHGRWRDGVVHHLFDEEVVPVCSLHARPVRRARSPPARSPFSMSSRRRRHGPHGPNTCARRGNRVLAGQWQDLHQLRADHAGRAGRAGHDAGLALDHRGAGGVGRPGLSAICRASRPATASTCDAGQLLEEDGAAVGGFHGPSGVAMCRSKAAMKRATCRPSLTR